MSEIETVAVSSPSTSDSSTVNKGSRGSYTDFINGNIDITLKS